MPKDFSFINIKGISLKYDGGICDFQSYHTKNSSIGWNARENTLKIIPPKVDF